MDFELLDGYLLDEIPSRGELVTRLLQDPAGVEGAAPFYEGMRLLKARTPDLTIIALRLVLAGKKADDASVVRLRDIVERSREGDESARREFVELLNA
jgi:hypothetical protein